MIADLTPEATHITWDIWYDPEWFDDNIKLKRDTVFWKSLLYSIAVRSGLEVVDEKFKDFEGGGISGVLVLATSHISIHTWPEYSYAAMDIYTCGESISKERFDFIIKDAKNILKIDRSIVAILKRGDFSEKKMVQFMEHTDSKA